MDESGMVWQLIFCFQKRVRLRKWFLKGPAVEPWAMVDGKSSSCFKRKTSGKLLRYLDGLVQGILFYIKKTSCSFGRGCALKNTKCFTKQPCIKYCCFCKISWAPHIPCIISDFPIPRVKVGCWVRLYSPLLICCFSEKGDRVRVTTVPNLACGCWTADLLRCVYRAASAPLWWYVPSCGPTLKVVRHLCRFVSFKQIWYHLMYKCVY